MIMFTKTAPYAKTGSPDQSILYLILLFLIFFFFPDGTVSNINKNEYIQSKKKGDFQVWDSKKEIESPYGESILEADYPRKSS